jgi:DNA polymerase-3 subunit epsilon
MVYHDIKKDFMAKTPIYYDTETTGTRPDKDKIIEIAAYDPINNRTFVQFIQPGCQIPSECIAISGITDEMVAGAPPFEVVGKNFIEFCGDNAVLIAHNNERFDKPFLESECLRANLSIPAWDYVDTLKWSRKYRSDLPSHALQAIREAYSFAANQAHRALDDVMMLYQIFSIMIDDLPIETVMALLSQSSDTGRMPFGKYQGKPLAEVPRDYFAWLKKSGALDKPENKELKEAAAKLNKI